MARALRVRLIAIKKEVNAAKLRVEDERLDLNRRKAELDAQQRALDEEYLKVQLQNTHAQVFGPAYANDAMFRCIPCFVFHDVLQNMRQTKSIVADVVRYKCRRCGEELNSDDQP